MKTNCIFLLLIFAFFSTAAQPFEGGAINNQFSNSRLKENIKTYNQYANNTGAFTWGWTFGATLELGNQNKGTFRLFTAVAVLQNFIGEGEGKIFGSFQSELELYRGGLGNSAMSPENAKFSLEWRNTPQLIFGYTDRNPNEIWGRPLMPSLGQSFSALYDPSDVSLSVGTSLINGINHSRNQQIGLVNIGALAFQGYYFNDGPPFHKIFLGDSYDRYWTGNGGLALYYIDENIAFTDVEVRYARYTGYQPLLYEMSNLLGIDYLPYKEMKEQHYNKGRFQYRAGIHGAMHLMYSVYQPKATDIQELIHWGSSAFHSNSTDRYHTFGFDMAHRNISIGN